MKKLILFALLAFTTAIITPTIFKSDQAQAQIVNVLTPVAANDTLTNTDTAWVWITIDPTYSKTFSTTGSITDNIGRSITVRVTKVSGTVAGTVALQGSNDATNWETIGTALTLTNVADQVKTFDMRSGGVLIYKYYQALFLCSGTNVQIPKVYYLRRSN